MPTIDIPRELLAHDPAHVATYAALAIAAADGDDSPTLMKLTTALGVTSPSTVVRRLQAMEREGLITRHAWPDGVKRVRYELRAPA